MKTIHFSFFVAAIFFCCSLSGQDTIGQYLQMMDYKIQLLEIKIKILEEKQKVLETTPQKTNQNLQNNVIYSEKIEKEKADTATYEPFRSAFKISPAHLYEGNFQLSYERALKNNFSIDIAAMGTYISSNGLGNKYMEGQELSYLNPMSNSYVPYDGRVITGFGVVLQGRNYLLPRIGSDINAPHGLYAAPQLMYRKTWITGYTGKYENSVWVEEIVKQNLDVFALGAVLGGKFSVFEVICIDIYVGGALRLSKYTNEKELTRNKDWRNIDYSGVLPTAGITIGILK